MFMLTSYGLLSRIGAAEYVATISPLAPVWDMPRILRIPCAWCQQSKKPLTEADSSYSAQIAVGIPPI